MLPRRSSTARRTTSRPTPRPETFVTRALVEKPGANTRACSSRSGRASCSAISPRATAVRRIASRSIPRPSSSTRMTTWAPACAAARRTRPRRRFPARSRSSGGSIPWSMQLRRRCTIGSLRRSITVLSSSVSSPAVSKSTSRPISRARSRTRRRNLPNVGRTGTIRMPRVRSRRSAVSRSTSSAMPASAGSAASPAWRVSRAWTVTSSPTRLTRASSRSAPTRSVLASPPEEVRTPGPGPSSPQGGGCGAVSRGPGAAPGGGGSGTASAAPQASPSRPAGTISTLVPGPPTKTKASRTSSSECREARSISHER